MNCTFCVSLCKNDDIGCEPMAKKIKCQTNADANGVTKPDGSLLECQGNDLQEVVKLENHKDVADELMIKENASGDQKFGEEQESSDLKPEEGHVTPAAELSASKNSDELLNFMENELVCSICQDILHNAVR